MHKSETAITERGRYRGTFREIMWTGFLVRRTEWHNVTGQRPIGGDEFECWTG